MEFGSVTTLLIVVLSLLGNVHIIEAQDSVLCNSFDTGIGVIDMNLLKGNEYYFEKYYNDLPNMGLDYTFHFKPCGYVSGCSTPLCQKTESPSNTYSLGNPSTASIADNKVLVTLTNGAYCSAAGIYRSSRIIIECGNETAFRFVREESTCRYTFSFTVFCPKPKIVECTPTPQAVESFDEMEIGYLDSNVSIFKGNAQLQSSSSWTRVYSTDDFAVIYGVTGSVYAQGYRGSQVVAGDIKNITFSTNFPITSFSGYFGYRRSTYVSSIQFRFFNSDNILLGSHTFVYPNLDGSLVFKSFCVVNATENGNATDSDSIRRIEFVGSDIVMDQLGISSPFVKYSSSLPLTSPMSLIFVLLLVLGVSILLN